MKTKSVILLSYFIVAFGFLQCTSTNKNNNVIIKEKIITNDVNLIDNPNVLPNTTNNEICNVIWEFSLINGESINSYIYENIPYIVFSNDSSYILINSGCNTYIGECSIKQNNEIKFDKITIKEEPCLIDALEREITYALSISNNFILNNNNLILFHNSTPTAFLITNNGM